MDEGRILQTKIGHFERGKWDGTNRSGIDPVCDKVVVRVDRAMEKVGSIHVPGDVSDRQSLAATTGVLVAVGPMAFVWDTDRVHRWDGDKPQPGMRVSFQKYAGTEDYGEDGELYRVMQDRSISGTRGWAEQAEPAGLVGSSSTLVASSDAELVGAA